MTPKPSVSIIVVTYNSEKYVEETLESAYYQDYIGSMHLIISDDGSNDRTLEICHEWCSKHHDRFAKVQILQTPENLGICGNYNFALKYVETEWVKFIAGDDILLPYAISNYVQAAQFTGDRAFCSAVITFNDDANLNLHDHQYGYRLLAESVLESKDPSVQNYNLLFLNGHGVVEGPTLFIHTQSLRIIGGMDERYPMLEDMTFALNWTKSGYHLGLIKDALVKYREYTESVSKKYRMTYFQKMTYEALFSARATFFWERKQYIKWWNWYIMRKFLKYDKKSLTHKMIRFILILSNIQMYIDKLHGRKKS